MSKSTKITWIIIVIVLILIAIFYVLGRSNQIAQQNAVTQSTATQVASSTPADDGAVASTTDTSDQAINQDMNNLNNQLNDLNTSAQEINNSVQQ